MTTFSSYDSTVNSFYLAFYGRPADPAGLKFWSKQLADNDGDLGAITGFFAASDEAQVRFGTDTVAERIAEIYQQLFNRAPEATGLAFWTKAIENGDASMADVAVSILKGAQGTDAGLATLRQQAVDAFTAQVDAEGSQYDGYASIEAARILVRAVTADASANDLAALVKAAVSFADTATKNPAVVEAIAVNTTLLALFDTPRGNGDPVALAQALADTAKAAAGDPVTLEQLLRGGGMDKVLKVMPANATLQDVVKALAEGGLPAAVEVVYPTTPSVPSAPSYKLSFLSVTEAKLDDHGMADTKADNVTREQVVEVTFGYRGNDLNSSHKYEYSINGSKWISGSEHIKVDTAANTVTLTGIDLSLGESINPAKSFGIMGAGPIGNLLSNIELRAVRSDETVIGSVKQQIVYDYYAEQPIVTVETSEAAQYFGRGDFTSVPNLNVEGIEPGARVEYALMPIQHGRVPNPQLDWSEEKPTLTDDDYYIIQVRQIDAAGNISDPRQISFTLDTKAPDTAVTMTLDTDSGKQGDGITNVKDIAIANLEKSYTSAWEYRIDGGEWTFGRVNNFNGKDLLSLDNQADGTFDIEVRQFDAAGNVGEPTSKQSFTFDTTAPEGKFSLDGVQGASKDDAYVTTLANADVYFEFYGKPDTGDTFEYLLDGGKWQTLDAEAYNSATGILTVGNVDFSTKDRDVSVRVVDAAGNATTSQSTLVDSTFNDVPPVTIDGLTPTFGLSGAKLALKVSIDSLASVDKTKLSLDVMNTGTAVDAPGFFDGNASQLTGNTLTLDDIPALNLYQLGWEEGAFTTTGGAAVAAGSALFVGGKIATVALPGYAIESLDLVGETGIDESNDVRVNTAFIGQEDVNARIHSGDGHDVVVDNGSKLTLSYDKLSNTLSDVVFGFDSNNGIASDIDKIELGGAISTRFDVNHNGALEWGTAVSPTTKYAPQPGIEAVELANLTSKSFIALAGADPLGALNATLDVSGFDAGEGLLILGTYQSQSILLSYVSKDSNGKVDEGELVTIAIYAQGTVDTDDITLVGSFMPPP